MEDVLLGCGTKIARIAQGCFLGKVVAKSAVVCEHSPHVTLWKRKEMRSNDNTFVRFANFSTNIVKLCKRTRRENN